jgi:hypothetical protein
VSSAQAEVDGQDAYTAYGDVVGWRNFQDLPMPAWENLPPKIRAGWIAAAAKAQASAAERAAQEAAP